MIFDLNNFSSDTGFNNQFDVVVVGAGAAGISCSLALSNYGLRVALVEAGSFFYEADSQELYRAEYEGDPYWELDAARLRFVGGTTNHWNGWCRTFEEVDFNRHNFGREFVWPIKKRDLDPYLSDACDILDIQNNFEDFDIRNSGLRSIKFQHSPPTRMREKFESELSDSENISLFINSNLTDLECEGARISGAVFESYNENKLTLRSDKIVFAMGGIENSRFLLWFSEKYEGLVRSNLPIGKYWMEHPHFHLGNAFIDKRKITGLYFSLSERRQAELGVWNCGLRLEHTERAGSYYMLRELACVAPELGRKLFALVDRDLVCGSRFKAAWEQEPCITNGVSLTHVKDRFGIPQAKLTWYKRPIDLETVYRSAIEFSDYLIQNDAGRVQLFDWVLGDSDYPPDDEIAYCHHMGGTRMHSSDEFGVVDSDCKVFGSENLYIAGSSVFTTGGHNNPTLPIVQLVLRLAEHLAAV